MNETSTQHELSSTEQRLCLFLSLLDDDITEDLLQSLPEARQVPLRAGIQQILNDPPSVETIETVIDEFDRIFRVLNTQSVSDQDEGKSPEAENAIDASGSAMQQLQLLDPKRLAAALRDEQPQAVAVLARQMPADRAGMVLAHLSPDLRSRVLIRLKEPLSPAPRLVEQLVEATVRRAIELDPRELGEKISAEQRMAQVLRAMPRRDRMDTMVTLGEAEPELAEAIQQNMFQFEDLLKVDDRSVKALLGDIETESLSIALKGAAPEFMEKVVRNLSRRAGEALQEEVEFMTPPSDEETAGAQMRVVQLMCKLDQEGVLQMMETEEAEGDQPLPSSPPCRS